MMTKLSDIFFLTKLRLTWRMSYADQVTSFSDLRGMVLAGRASLSVCFADGKRTESREPDSGAPERA